MTFDDVQEQEVAQQPADDGSEASEGQEDGASEE